MKESFTIVKPQIAEDFVTKLKKKMNETENGDFLIGHDDLNECVGELARNIMTRERHNFDRQGVLITRFSNKLRNTVELGYLEH